MTHPLPDPAPGAPDDPRPTPNRYAAWAVYERTGTAVDEGRTIADLDLWQANLAASDVVLRGAYDVSGLRAGTDLMLWLHGPSAESIQAALRGFRRTGAGEATRLAWSLLGSHRPAEFARDHVPSFLLGTSPKAWLCVYPFVRSYDWYLLPAEERGGMLREHGIAGRAYAGVQANTVSAFALNDYEWILALESDDLNELVDLMRGLRATEARRHVREEVPFHTGRRVTWTEALEVLR
jgi:chlorite dismutase